MCNLPEETGLYWAKRNGNPWEYIIEIKGVKPFLSYNVWDLKYPDRDHSPCNAGMDSINTFTFDNKLDFYDQHLVRVDKPGLYVIFSKDLKLAYITGTVPYMSCYTWNVKENTRTKVKNAWNLSFTEYIEKPENDE